MNIEITHVSSKGRKAYTTKVEGPEPSQPETQRDQRIIVRVSKINRRRSRKVR